MEALIGTGIALFAGQFALLWYRIGKMEQKLTDLCREVRDGKK
jgi:hypothetical protein